VRRDKPKEWMLYLGKIAVQNQFKEAEEDDVLFTILTHIVLQDFFSNLPKSWFFRKACG
jgi:hypothetical protein